MLCKNAKFAQPIFRIRIIVYKMEQRYDNSKSVHSDEFQKAKRSVRKRTFQAQ